MRFLILFFIFVNLAYSLTPFDLHNVSKAHGQNITGAGIEIGIIDDAFRSDHRGLTGSVIEATYPYINSAQGRVYYNPNFRNDTHGSHVAGIAVGNKINNSLPYGIAYDAKFYGMGIFASGRYTSPESFAFFNPKGVKIINNSWGSNVYPSLNLEIDAAGRLITCSTCSVDYVLRQITRGDITSGLYRLSTQNNVLNVFAAGNEGIMSPGSPAVAARYDENLRAWLAVGALDASYINRDSNGRLIVDARGVAEFSNGFIGAENFSLVAAGSFINSVDSRNTSSFTQKSGTSMAAPTVSGVAALIQQKFPFLNGKQIADVLLSTADKNYQAPKMIVKQVDDSTTKYLIVYIDQAVPTSEAEIKADLEKEYGSYYLNGKKWSDLIWENRDSMQRPQSSIQGTMQASKEQVFGQGILDAQNALRGLATLDINRLNDKDVASKNGIKEAFYTIDTAGFDGIFENDLSQKKWDSSLHLADARNLPKELSNLNAGLIKTGAGSLTLRGTNSYEGASIVRNGELRLEKRSDGTGGTLAGSVFIERGARLNILGADTMISTPTLSASIKKDLTNEGGTLLIGSRGLGLLDVEGTYTQKDQGILQLSFNSGGNSALKARSYNIENGSLQYYPLLAQLSNEAQTIKINLQELGASLDKFSQVTVVPNSQVFNYTLLDDKITLEVLSRQDAYENFAGANSSLASALRNIASLPNLPTNYTEFFTSLNTKSQEDYEKSIKSIDSNGHQMHTEQMGKVQVENALNNILHLFDQAPSGSLYADQKTYYAASGQIATDLSNLYGLGGSNNLWYFSPSYHYSQSDERNSKGIGGSLGVTKLVSKTSSSLYIGYNQLDSSFDYSTLKSKIISSGLHISSPLSGKTKLLAGLNAAFAQNDLQRELYQNPTNIIKGSYNTIFASAQLGLSRGYEAYTAFKNSMNSSFIISPLAYLSYNFSHQQAFKEIGQLFSKSYEAFNHHTVSATAGLNFSYIVSKNKDNTSLNFYSAYERLLLGDELKNKAQFNDFNQDGFNQSYTVNKDTVRLGANLEQSIGKAFFQIGIDSHLSKKEQGFNIVGKAGLSF
ncbi:S8 family serine peptidase [Campylobacter troglodytis]|uniref:S8 family serine peptidase n=1 Tax=Campylobacter troglodytis TaxID=654363 RepID=UPI00163BD681|nr:S8 family serine peptidase [Campylobacter troglodytis]